MKIVRATVENLQEVATLFDKYRQFYQQVPDYEACSEFIFQRITNNESVIFISRQSTGQVTGFTQLYESFCSVEMKRLIYLYDLFVDVDARQCGTARALMNAAADYARERQADRLVLETGIDNIQAQTLYESLGYRKDVDFYTYHLGL